MSEIVQQTAKDMLEAGFSVIPVKENKKSIGTWKQYQKQQMPLNSVPTKFNGADRFAIICGEVSGNLECIDVDDKTCWESFSTIVKAKHKNILNKLIFTKTPNGYGIVYRCESKIPGNIKLAKEWIEVEGEGNYTWQGRPTEYVAKEVEGKWIIDPTMLETRGESGYFLTSPSPGYEILHGSFHDLEPISEEDRNSLITLAKSYDKRPLKHRPEEKSIKPAVTQKLKIPWPGDVYNEQTDLSALLHSYGWTKTGKVKDGITFSRPGAPANRTSATLYNDGKLHVFSSNADPLEEGKQYTAFAILTYYDFNGDFSESTKSLIDNGFHVELTPEQLKEILKDNPDELEDAYSRSGLSEAEVSAVASELKIPLPPGRSVGRIQIIYDKLELNRVVQEMDTALSKVFGSWGYFKFSSKVGYVTEDNTFKAYDKDTLELRAEQSLYMLQWEKPRGAKKARLTPIRVHEHLLRKLLSFPDSSAAYIRGFAQHPLIDQNGEVVGLEDGFENGIMFSKCAELDIKVDERSFEECYNRIVELFCKDILFKDRKIGEALFVSMLMTALCRLGIKGGCPGYFITANEPGTGKSTMFEFVSRIVYGKMVHSVDWGEDSVERRKEIIAVLREGTECLVFDNIAQGEEIKSPILAQAITAGEIKNRILGKSEAVKIQAQSLFVFIGNNLNMSTELARRLLTIELLTRKQNPEKREVSVVNIEAHCEKHRAEVIGCLLKMVKEGLTMAEEIKQSSGHTFWDKFIRNPLLTKTGVDVAAGFEKSHENSEENSDVESLMFALAEVFGLGAEKHFTAKDVYLAIADEKFLNQVELKHALHIKEGSEQECMQLRDVMITLNAKSSMILKSTGRVLAAMEDRVVGDMRFVRHKTRSKTPIKHWIEVIED